MQLPEAVDPTVISQTVVELISTWGLRVIGAIVLLAVGWTIAGLIRRWVRRSLQRSKIDPTLVPFVATVAYYGFMTFVVLAALGLFGIQTTSLVAILGAAGLAVGLALQGTLSNFAAGIMLLIFRPFRVGDAVEVGGVTGKVDEIGIAATTLNTFDNVRIIVPNSSVYGATIKNFSANDIRRIDLIMGVAYSDDLGTAKSAIERVISQNARVLSEPAPVIAVSELADSSVNFVVRPWCNAPDYWDLRFELTRTLKEEIEKAGCSIPFPQRDVHLFQAQG